MIHPAAQASGQDAGDSETGDAENGNAENGDAASPQPGAQSAQTGEPSEEGEPEVALAVNAAAAPGRDKRGMSALWLIPPVGLAGLLAYWIDKKRRRGRHSARK